MPWVRPRDNVARSSREVELAKHRVEFIEAWLKVNRFSISDEENGALRMTFLCVIQIHP